MFGEIESLEQAIKYAQTLQEGLCCYASSELGSEPRRPRHCDCKFVKEGQGLSGFRGENTGCCEARAILRFFQALKIKEELSETEPKFLPKQIAWPEQYE